MHKHGTEPMNKLASEPGDSRRGHFHRRKYAVYRSRSHNTKLFISLQFFYSIADILSRWPNLIHSCLLHVTMPQSSNKQ